MPAKIHDRPHECPRCQCDPPEIVVKGGVRMDTRAPFFGLVIEISRTKTKEPPTT